MGFIPEEKEERKWFIRVILLGILGLLIIFLFAFVLPIIIPNAILFYIFDFSLYGILFFIIGLFAGLSSNLNENKLSKICFKGILCLETLPFLFLFFFIALGGFIFISLLLSLLIFFTAISCSVGSRSGTKLRRKRTVITKASGK